jgi:hypothetical protein|tara:strand:+ start:27 stop:728 length:702 start_codon:yes stop_codon:yes gene_type:complete
MALPKIDLPMFEALLPSTGEKITYRPFTVKEEKIMLVAGESDDAMQQVLAIKQIVNNCVLNKDISDIAMFDLEYLLLLLRARSVDNEVAFEVVDPDTGEEVKLVLDIDKVAVELDEAHTKKVPINEEYTLLLKYPSIDEFIKITSIDTNDPLASYFIMISCLDAVASDDEVYSFKDYTDKEIDDFMENVSGEVVKGIQKFFDSMPKLRHIMPYKNKNGDDKTFVVEGIRSFFI